jgi:MoaA/NifB/PqqE/SkfB family radical SAM enzyme
MLKFLETVRVLHLEPTDICQAACPLCARETDPTFNKDLQHSLTVEDIKRILPEHVIARLDKMFMCGTYGDPAAGPNTLELYKYFRSVNSDITLGMNTNGGLQNTNWWKTLAKQFSNPLDYVVFSIDGLEDTNHVYRKNVSWNRVIANAEAFISGGGAAQWDMLIYEHNEHQVDACEQLARDMGFKWFRAKVSKRTPTVSWLKAPKSWTRPVVEQGPVNCFRDNEQSLYVSAQGVIRPCCWLGTETLDDFEDIRANWNTDKCNPICKETCSTVNNVSNYTGQWQRNVPLEIT